MGIVHSSPRKLTTPFNPECDKGLPFLLPKDEEAASIPPELTMEILTWLPLEPLARAQLVCREWRALIQDRHFMRIHMNRSPDVYFFYNTIPDPIRNPGPAKPDTFAYLHGCDGLLLIRNNNTLHHFLWNPATKLLLSFPKPHTPSYGFTLSFAPATGRYKAVSFFKHQQDELRCQLITPGDGPSMEWRRLEFPPEANADTTDAEVSVVPAGGVPHCVVLREAGHKTVAEIISVDVDAELLTVNRLPRGVFRDAGAVNVVDCEGKLGLAVMDLNKLEMQVMVLQDFKEKRWCRNKEVTPLPFLGDEEYKGRNVVPFLMKEGGIWFCLEDEKVFVYSVKTGKTRDVVKHKGISVVKQKGIIFSSVLYSYKPSMITFQGMRADEEIAHRRPQFLF